MLFDLKQYRKCLYPLWLQRKHKLEQYGTDMASQMQQIESNFHHKWVDIGILLACLGMFLLNAALLCCLCTTSVLQVSATTVNTNEIKAIRAVLGEAEGESYESKLALCGALRNRGSFKGVYGYKAVKYVNGKYYRGKRLIHTHAVHEALTAWIESESLDTSNHATGWGNEADVNKFCSMRWWSKCIITAHIGNHWFYKLKKG